MIRILLEPGAHFLLDMDEVLSLDINGSYCCQTTRGQQLGSQNSTHSAFKSLHFSPQDTFAHLFKGHKIKL